MQSPSPAAGINARSAGPEPVVCLVGVTKRIGAKTIIDGLTFDVPHGEVFGFLGPNGAWS